MKQVLIMYYKNIKYSNKHVINNVLQGNTVLNIC